MGGKLEDDGGVGGLVIICGTNDFIFCVEMVGKGSKCRGLNMECHQNAMKMRLAILSDICLKGIKCLRIPKDRSQ